MKYRNGPEEALVPLLASTVKAAQCNADHRRARTGNLPLRCSSYWGVVLGFQIGECRVGQPGTTPVASNFLNVTVLDVFITRVLIPFIVRPRSLEYCAEYRAPASY